MGRRIHGLGRSAGERLRSVPMSGEPNRTLCDVSECQTGALLSKPGERRTLCAFHHKTRELYARDNCRTMGFRAALAEWDATFPRKAAPGELDRETFRRMTEGGE